MRKTLIELIASSVLLAGQSPLRDFPVGGPMGELTLPVNMQTGAFKFTAHGFEPGTTYYLQLHKEGYMGAGVVGSAVANPEGEVDITGKLDTEQLQLLDQNRADLSISPLVL